MEAFPFFSQFNSIITSIGSSIIKHVHKHKLGYAALAVGIIGFAWHTWTLRKQKEKFQRCIDEQNAAIKNMQDECKQNMQTVQALKQESKNAQNKVQSLDPFVSQIDSFTRRLSAVETSVDQKSKSFKSTTDSKGPSVDAKLRPSTSAFGQAHLTKNQLNEKPDQWTQSIDGKLHEQATTLLRVQQDLAYCKQAAERQAGFMNWFFANKPQFCQTQIVQTTQEPQELPKEVSVITINDESQAQKIPQRTWLQRLWGTSSATEPDIKDPEKG